MKKKLKDRLKKIDDFFDSLTVEEFEKIALECGMDKESSGRIMFDVEEDYMDEQVAIAFLKQDVAWLKTELKEPVGIKTMMSALESRVCAEELAIEALTERMEKGSGWIPVSEILPRDDQMVFTCDNYDNIHIMHHHKDFEDPFGIGCNHPRINKVVAWMPLPKPYKELVNE